MKHQPNFENLRRTLLREGPPGPVPFFEIGAEPGVMGAVLGEKFPLDLHIFRPPSPLPPGEEGTRAAVRTLDLFVKFSVEMGYDYVFMFVPFNLPRHVGQTVDSAAPPGWSDGFRYWENEVKGPIQSWEASRSTLGPILRKSSPLEPGSPPWDTCQIPRYRT